MHESPWEGKREENFEWTGGSWGWEHNWSGWGLDGKGEYWKRLLEKEDISEFDENLVQRILPGIYMDDFN